MNAARKSTLSYCYGLSIDSILTSLWALEKAPSTLNSVRSKDVPISDKRAQEEARSATHPPKPEGVHEQDLQIPSRASRIIPVRIYSVVDEKSMPCQLFVMIHGGGFHMGGLSLKEEDCRRLVSTFQFVVINVDYRLAPEYVWPAAVEDCWDVIIWECYIFIFYTKLRMLTSLKTVSNPAQLNANLSAGFIVGGESAGANLCAVMSILALNQKLHPRITGLVLSIPSLVNPDYYLQG